MLLAFMGGFYFPSVLQPSLRFFYSFFLPPAFSEAAAIFTTNCICDLQQQPQLPCRARWKVDHNVFQALGFDFCFLPLLLYIHVC